MVRQFNKLLRAYGIQQAKELLLKEKSHDCPDDNLICGFVDDTLSDEERAVVESHIATCDYCPHHVADLFKAIFQQDINSGHKIKFDKKRRFTMPNEIKCSKCQFINSVESKYCSQCGKPLEESPSIIFCWKCNKIVNFGNIYCNHCGVKLVADKKDAKKELYEAVKKWLPETMRENKWLVAAIVTILVSFAFPAVFIQFCIAAGIFGGMWIFDSVRRDMLIKLYRAWKSGDKEKIEIITAELKKKISEDGRSAKEKLDSFTDKFRDRFTKK